MTSLRHKRGGIMNFLKISSLFILTTLLMLAFIPEASARHHCRSQTSFGLSFNTGGPSYVVPAPAPVVIAPAPVVYPGYVTPAPVYSYPYPYSYTYYGAPNYGAPNGYYSAPVVVERPGTYVRPGFSYSYWR